MIWIDEDKIVSEIEKMKPKIVAFNAPNGLLMKIEELASKIQGLFNLQIITFADPCYGICDTVDNEVEKLGVDIVFHIGHNVAIDKIGKKTILIDALDDIKFDEVLKASITTLMNYKKIGLCTISQHIHQIEIARSFLQKKNLEVIVGKRKGFMKDGQVLGCDFSTAFNIRKSVNAFAFLGQSVFHALGIALSTGKPTFMLDPYYREVSDITPLAVKMSNKAILTLYKALDANNIGIIIGLKEGQTRLEKVQKIKDELEKHGKNISLIALHEITNERLTQLQNIDAFIQTACPRISIDGEKFNKPILSIPQAEALIEILDGRECKNIFQNNRWV